MGGLLPHWPCGDARAGHGDTHFERIRCLADIVLIASILMTNLPLAASERQRSIPNGTWIIESTPPADAVRLSEDYLPTGTRLQLLAEGPTRRAVEEQISDELGGTLTLLPTLSERLCGTGIGASTTFSYNLCTGEKLRIAQNASVEFDDAIFVFSRFDSEDAANRANFFVRQGARIGARFARVILKYKGVDWELWLRSSDEMVSQCIADLPGEKNYKSFPMIWRRQVAP